MTSPLARPRQALGAAVAWMSGALVYLIFEAIAAKAFRPHYSYAHNLISDLGIPSRASALAWLMNTAFCLQGTLFLVGAILAVRAIDARRARAFLTLAAVNAVGNILIAIFHSGPAAQADRTAWVHATGAVLAIVGGNAAILAGSCTIGGPPWHCRISAGLAALGLLSFMMFVIESSAAGVQLMPPAVWERCSVYSITTWQMFAATWLFTRSRFRRPD